MVEIRPVEPGEMDQAAEVVLAAYRALWDLTTTGGYEAQLRDVAGRAAAATVLVAVEDGRVLGCVTLVEDPDSPWSEGFRAGEAGIRMLAVAPEATGRGVGTALVDACVERARALGMKRAVLHSTKHMEPAQRIYRRAGFVREPDRDVSLPGFHLLAYGLWLDGYGAARPGGGTGQTQGA